MLSRDSVSELWQNEELAVCDSKSCCLVQNVGEGARSATAVKRARVVQPLEAPKRSPVTAVLERPALRQVSSPGQSPATLLPNRRGISANAAAPKVPPHVSTNPAGSLACLKLVEVPMVFYMR